MTDNDDILAAEFALGLLTDADAEAVTTRARTDAALSLRIAWWRDQLTPLVNESATQVPDHVWHRICDTLPVNDNFDAARPWKWATGGLGAIAAALLLFITTRAPSPIEVRPAPAAPMVAALSGETGAIVAVSYNADTGGLTIAPTTLDPGTGDAELWIIPEGGTPVSLGTVDANSAAEHSVSAARRALVRPGATFAITQEVKGGSPDGAPHGPIVAAGKIIRA